MSSSRVDEARSIELLSEGNVQWGLGRREMALELYRSAHSAAPNVLTAYSIGMALEQAGDEEAAASNYRAAISLDPLRLEPRVNLGSLSRRSDLEEALHHHLIGCGAHPDHPLALYNLAITFAEFGCGAEALSLLKRCLEVDPQFSAAGDLLARQVVGLGRRVGEILGARETKGGPTADAVGRLVEIVLYQSAIAFAPRAGAAWLALSLRYLLADLPERAWDAALLATECDVKSGEAWSHFEAVSRKLRRRSSCYKALEALLEIWPMSVSAMANLGGMLIEDQRHREAVALLEKAAELQPNDPHLLLNIANAHLGLQNPEKALKALALARDVKPDDGALQALLMATAAHSCNWPTLHECSERVKVALREGLDPHIAPFLATAIPGIDSADQLRISRRFIEQNYPNVMPMRRDLPPRDPRSRMKVGYLSSEFRSHATTYLIAEMIELHDRSRFEVCAFSATPSDNTFYRNRIEAAFDRFFDIHEMTDIQAASLIAGEGIDLLVDLNCYTGVFRPGVFAYRPAPIQVNFLGYPGTSGADFMDYIIGDPIVTPEGCEPFYSERIARLPNCYQPNDRKRPLPERPSRQSVGLPETGFVFCCFNQAFKLTADRFDVWSRLLSSIPDSVLWLLTDSAEVRKNLVAEAALRGIGSDRIIFAPRIEVSRHMQRFRCADLFLDTGPYNAHTTASDALWSGVPVVTKAGETFASRVAASILSAAELPELIAHTDDEYFRIALSIAQSPEYLSALRRKLEQIRFTCSLFDTRSYTAQLEKLYVDMWARHQDLKMNAYF